MKKNIRIALLMTAAIGLSIGLTACTGQAAAPEITVQNVQGNQNAITVHTKESINVVPDVADISLGVTTQAEDAASCQNQNNDTVDKIVAALTALGIPETSIQTSRFNLSPRYDWKDSVQTLIGYEMNTTITLSDIALDQVGSVLTQSVDAGANNFDSIVYKSSQYDASYQEALKLAVESAKVKAQSLAEASGRTLGDVLTVEEQTANDTARYAPGNGIALEGYAKAADSARVMPGEVSVEANITVTFNLQ